MTLFAIPSTYQGHGTDKVLFGGLLGLDTDDTQIRQSIEMAKEYGMEFDFEFKTIVTSKTIQIQPSWPLNVMKV